MAWRRTGGKPLSEPMMSISLTHIRHTASMIYRVVYDQHLKQPHSTMDFCITHCGLMTPYTILVLGQHWSDNSCAYVSKCWCVFCFRYHYSDERSLGIFFSFCRELWLDVLVLSAYVQTYHAYEITRLALKETPVLMHRFLIAGHHNIWCVPNYIANIHMIPHYNMPYLYTSELNIHYHKQKCMIVILVPA